MPYIKPADVVSPKAHWSLIDVLLDRGEGDCAYALGIWDGERRIGFRWNGSGGSELGNPQSRGLPTWTMLDTEIHKPIIEQLPPEKLAMARGFLGIKLMLEGPTLEGTSGGLVFYDFFQNPPVLVKLSCKALRNAVQRPEISDADCQLLAMRHGRVLTAVAAVVLEKGESTLREDGRFRIIELESKAIAEGRQPTFYRRVGDGRRRSLEQVTATCLTTILATGSAAPGREPLKISAPLFGRHCAI